MSQRDAGQSKATKSKKAQKAKGKRGGDAGAPVDDRAIRIGAHPRARRSVRRARAWAGMGGFALVWLLAARAGVPQFEAVLRALAGGMFLHLMAWAFAITLWRRLIVAEFEAAHERVRGRLEAPSAR